MIIWAHDHMMIWWYDDMISWSYDHMIIWSYEQRISYDHRIIWSYDQTIIWSYDSTQTLQKIQKTQTFCPIENHYFWICLVECCTVLNIQLVKLGAALEVCLVGGCSHPDNAQPQWVAFFASSAVSHELQFLVGQAQLALLVGLGREVDGIGSIEKCHLREWKPTLDQKKKERRWKPTDTPWAETDT